MKKLLLSFKVYYLIYVLLAFNAFVNISAWMTGASVVLIVWGMAVSVGMLIQYKSYIKVKNFWLLLGFLISYVVSSLLTMRYGVVDNIKELIWMWLFMIVLYLSMATYTTEEKKKEMRILSYVWLVITTITHMVSVTMVVWGREFAIALYDADKIVDYKVIGYKWNRLWGMYDDPNHGATIAVISVLLTLYLVKCVKKMWIKVLLSVTVLIHFSYIVLSDSRTGMISLGVGLCVWMAVRFYERLKCKGIGFVKAVSFGTLAGIVIAVCVVGSAFVCKQGYNNTIDRKIEAAINKGKHTKTDKKKKTTVKTERKKDIEKDVTNGRLDIWGSGIEIAESSPIFGVSFRNIVAYADDQFPETYLVHNPQEGKYDSLHNSVMDILVSQGIVGVVLIILLIVNVLKLMKECLCRTVDEDRMLLAICMAIMLAMAAGSMFLSMVFYLNAPQTYMFWLCLGCFVTMLQGEKSRS